MNQGVIERKVISIVLICAVSVTLEPKGLGLIPAISHFFYSVLLHVVSYEKEEFDTDCS